MFVILATFKVLGFEPKAPHMKDKSPKPELYFFYFSFETMSYYIPCEALECEIISCQPPLLSS